jgi:hypothetical protein
VRFAEQPGFTKKTVFSLPILKQSTCWTEGSFYRKFWGQWVNESTFSTVVNLKHCPALLTNRPSWRCRNAFISAKWAFESIGLQVFFHSCLLSLEARYSVRRCISNKQIQLFSLFLITPLLLQIKNPRHKAGGTRSAVLFSCSFLLTDARHSEYDEHSRKNSQGLVKAGDPKRLVLRKHLVLVQRLKTKGCKDFSFGVSSTGFTFLDSGYGQRRDSCFSGKL